jgi:hypothetical protein
MVIEVLMKVDLLMRLALKGNTVVLVVELVKDVEFVEMFVEVVKIVEIGETVVEFVVEVVKIVEIGETVVEFVVEVVKIVEIGEAVVEFVGMVVDNMFEVVILTFFHSLILIVLSLLYFLCYMELLHYYLVNDF